MEMEMDLIDKEGGKWNLNLIIQPQLTNKAKIILLHNTKDNNMAINVVKVYEELGNNPGSILQISPHQGCQLLQY